MKINIRRFDKSLPLPEYKTKGAAAFDLYVRQKTTIPAHKVGMITLNIAIQLPADHWALLAARSSLYKRGLMLANGIGIGDYDYRGDQDEYKAAIYNFTDEDVIVNQGERIVQMIIISRERVEFIEKKKFTAKNRGGFGTTGSE